MKYKCVGVVMLSALLGACQWAGPIFVEYNGVRRDVAEWINGQNLLSMQQKRSLAQLSRAEQPLMHADKAEDPATRLALAKSHQEAMHCAYLGVACGKNRPIARTGVGRRQGAGIGLLPTALSQAETGCEQHTV